MSRKREPEQKKAKLVPFDHAVYTLRIPLARFYACLHAGRFRQRTNDLGQPCIGEDDLRTLANSSDIRAAAMEWFRGLLATNCSEDAEDERMGKNAEYRAEIGERIRQYREYIRTLEKIHMSYRDRIDVLEDESALVAAYVLYSRVIGLLNMTCVCLREGYWESGVLLRLIDETVDLAWHFVASEGTEQGDRSLREWFRLNIAPQHATCRKTISGEVTQMLGKEKGDVHAAAMAQLYERKSKWVHPTYISIMEVYRPSTPQGQGRKSGFDYDTCSNAHKMLGLTDFFRSSIWTGVQGFIMCFATRMPLREEDKQTLYSLDDMFGRQLEKVPLV